MPYTAMTEKTRRSKRVQLGDEVVCAGVTISRVGEVERLVVVGELALDGVEVDAALRSDMQLVAAGAALGDEQLDGSPERALQVLLVLDRPSRGRDHGDRFVENLIPRVRGQESRVAAAMDPGAQLGSACGQRPCDLLGR